MNNFELITAVIEPFFPIILFILVVLAIFALRSLWPRSTPAIEDFYTFEKSQTDYIKPPRPHSDLFHDYHKLALMSTSHRQQELAQLVSKMIKEYIESKKGLLKLEYSENLSILLSDPKTWHFIKINQIDQSISAKKDENFEFLYQQYIEVFKEVEYLLDIHFSPLN